MEDDPQTNIVNVPRVLNRGHYLAVASSSVFLTGGLAASCLMTVLIVIAMLPRSMRLVTG
jgi:hypothetical protein